MQLTQQFCQKREDGKVSPKRFFVGLLWTIFFSSLLLCGGFSVTNVRAQAGAGTALRFGSTNAFVQVAANTNFNGYPFTVSAWFRTTNGTAIVQGIVSK